MEAHYIADRSLLLALLQQHPNWTNSDLAQATGRSLGWVKKWKARFRAAPHPVEAIWGSSRAQGAGSRFPPEVIEQVLAIRDAPPEHLHRRPGPRTILYYLARSPEIAGERLPRSTRTIWKILRAGNRIAARHPRSAQALDRPAPLVEIPLDFKDVVQVDPLVSAKHAHAVEVLDAVDVGTSLWLLAEPSAAYTAETVFGPLVHLLEQMGLPERVRFDRDPRFLGNARTHDFPSPFVRFWYALGVQPVMNPPHRPDLNAFVERLHGTLEHAYRQVQLPASLEATRESLPAFVWQYHQERPHQGRSCGNRPPAVAHPQLPRRPRLPARVDPDRWVVAYHERCFARRVKSNGSVTLDERHYYVGSQYVRQQVIAQLDAPTRQVAFFDHQRTLLNVKPLQGLVEAELSLEAFVDWCEREARTLWRRSLNSRRSFKQAG